MSTFQSHTGITMANAFQAMLEHFGLTEKIIAVNADNATANDKQTTKLATLDNSFEETNRVLCFNHTFQLSVKALLAPFNTAISGKATHDSEVLEEDNINESLPEVEQDNDDSSNDNDGDSNSDNNDGNGNDDNDGIDELQELSQGEQVHIIESMADVCVTVTKV